MGKYLIIGILLLSITAKKTIAQTVTPTADSIRHRIIFIGDAGEIDKQQQAVIPDAASHIIPGKTTVLYLGDNIYPKGMGLPGSTDEERTKNILQSQYQPMRSKGAPVYFIPGNHDWDKMGKNGLAKIKRQWEFLNEQNDPLLQLVPANGCPDPVEINVDDSLTIIAFDSEWWLFPFSKANPEADCDCTTKDEVITKFNELFYKNRYKVILLASHHPFESYGIHGGHFPLKDHLFPLTNVNKNLYIPLPVVGSLYPILRSVFSNPEDLRHPLYKDMIRRIEGVFGNYPNLIHVAGHEHGLQFIKDKQIQVVSGAGAKNTYAHKGSHSLFANAVQGYVIADLLTGNVMRFTYFIYNGTTTQVAFTYTQAYQPVQAQEDSSFTAIKGDSLTVSIRPGYNKVSKLHRKLFGENYRKEFAAPTTLPVIHLSQIHGGLLPEKKGGGMQTISLRLKDNKGNEWALRNLEKDPDPLLPEALRGTFARTIVDDYMSAQHPFAPLVVPVLANAAGVPHANPVIGIIAPDSSLGIFQKLFAGKVALLEEREPLGKSDNTSKMQENLRKDNDNNYDSKTFLRARLLDMLLSDWDRHPDQWRWADTKKGSEKFYEPVPRDRDQALYVRQGLIPYFASRPWVLPTLQSFGGKIKHVKYSLFKSSFNNAHLANQFSFDEWMQITNDFTKAITDSVIETAFRRLPASAYQLRGEKLANEMKERRNNIPAAMEHFYHFINRIVDIEATNKNELFEITGTSNGSLSITAKKINKEGKIKEVLMSKVYDPAITKEIRLYLLDGDDSVIVNNPTSPIRLRIIGGNDHKIYNVIESRKKIKLYTKYNTSTFTVSNNRIKKHLSDDSLNTTFIPVNLYNVVVPLIVAGYNLDDGLLLGLSIKYTHQGFRKTPYSSVQQIHFNHSFSTDAFRFGYKGEWVKAAGNADLQLNVLAKAPENTQNFFGRGNETVFNKTGDYKRYYRARFAIYEIEPALRWKSEKGSSLSIGPSFQFYHYNAEDNIGRFTTNTSFIGSYDSSTIKQDKSHLGLVMNYTHDKRNNKIFPAWGSYINIRVQGYTGMNGYSKSFVQVTPEVALYKSLNARQTIILAERLGGGVSFGKTAFYQSLFIGGQENLLGYRQYRFAGQHSFYNNLELRIKLADFASYILPGQFGLTGFFDIGRVWENHDNSGEWHNGVGGGFYFAPAQLVVLQLVAGHSTEGWYPYFTMGFRF
jgi:hypothetical protein